MIRPTSRYYPHKTLGDFAHERLALRAHCRVCGHNALLSLLDLIARYGAETPSIKLRPFLRCSSCKRRSAHLHEVGR